MNITYGLEEVASIAHDHILPLMKSASIFTFTGPLGAGKTTLISTLLKELGVSETVTSPTFTYVNSYTNNRGQTFHHFDLYRLSSAEEFVGAGFDEYLEQKDSWCFVEWPGVIKALLDEPEIANRVVDCELRHVRDGDLRQISYAFRSNASPL